MNQYVVIKNQQIAIEAEDFDQALTKALADEGKTSGVSYNVQLRPPPPQQRPTVNVVAAPAPSQKP